MLNILEKRLTAIMDTGPILAEGRAVKAFIHSSLGQEWANTFPSISYDIGYPQFDPSRYFDSDANRIKTPASQKEVMTLLDGSTRIGYRQITTRPHPKPYKIPVTFNLWGKTSSEVNDMSDNMLRVFNPRGTISFIDDLGEPRTWWMFLRGAPEDMSSLYERLDEERKFQIVYRYMVEGWLEDIAKVKQQPTISEEAEVTIGILTP